MVTQAGFLILMERNHQHPGEGNGKGIEGKGLHHWMTHAPPWDSPGTLLCHQDMEERFTSHFNEIFKERILPINNHELECLCVSS